MIIDGTLREFMTVLLLIKNISLKVKKLLFNFCPGLTFGNTMSV